MTTAKESGCFRCGEPSTMSLSTTWPPYVPLSACREHEEAGMEEFQRRYALALAEYGTALWAAWRKAHDA